MSRKSLMIAAGVVLATGLLGAAEPAADAASVRPLLVGASTPAVSVANADGQRVALRSVTSGQPTVLIFYRGGW